MCINIIHNIIYCLQISIILLEQKCSLFSYLKRNTSVKMKYEELNDSKKFEDEDFKSNLTRSVIEETIDCDESCTVEETSKKSSSETYSQNVLTFKEDIISGIDPLTSEFNDSYSKEIADFENTLWTDVISLEGPIISSTPQNESHEGKFFDGYRRLSIPQEAKYIEIILCCNRNPVTSYAQLAENNDIMFSEVSIHVNLHLLLNKHSHKASN